MRSDVPADRASRLGAIWGLTFGIAMVAMTTLPPQPYLGVIFWSVMAVSMLHAAVVTWRRMGLPLTTAAMATGCVMFVGLAVLHARGVTINALPNPWFAIFIAIGLFGAASHFVERRINRDKLDRWAEHMAHARFRDMLLMRHVPDLRK